MKVTYLTQDELRRLFDKIKVIGDRRDWAIFLVAYRHGLRASEVGLLRRSDVDFARGKIFIRRVERHWTG